MDSDHAAGQLLDHGHSNVGKAIPLFLPISLNPLVHFVDEETSLTLLHLSLLEEDLFGDGMCLRHNPLLVCGDEEVQESLVKLWGNRIPPMALILS